MRDAFADELLRLAREDSSIELLTGDLGFGVLRPFKEEFPDRFHNVGIAEQLLIEMATGMTLAGKKVVCYSIGNFPVLRCLEQIRNDAAYSGANVKIVEIGGGYTYGQLGMSHNATEDLACLLPIPGMTIYAPADASEARWATREMMTNNCTCFLRLERPNPAKLSEGDAFGLLGSLRKVVSGNDTAVVSYGGIAINALEVAKKLGYAMYSCPRLKPFDAKETVAELSQYKKVVVVEEHSFIGGLGSYLASVLNGRVPVEIFGIPDTVAPVVGSQDYMRDYVGLSIDKLITRIREDE